MKNCRIHVLEVVVKSKLEIQSREGRICLERHSILTHLWHHSQVVLNQVSICQDSDGHVFSIEIHGCDGMHMLFAISELTRPPYSCEFHMNVVVGFNLEFQSGFSHRLSVPNIRIMKAKTLLKLSP